MEAAGGVRLGHRCGSWAGRRIADQTSRRAIASLSSETEGVQVEIADTGAGIPGEEHDLVFKPFHRGEASRSSDGAGLAEGRLPRWNQWCSTFARCRTRPRRDIVQGGTDRWASCAASRSEHFICRVRQDISGNGVGPTASVRRPYGEGGRRTRSIGCLTDGRAGRPCCRARGLSRRGSRAAPRPRSSLARSRRGSSGAARSRDSQVRCDSGLAAQAGRFPGRRRPERMGDIRTSGRADHRR